MNAVYRVDFEYINAIYQLGMREMLKRTMGLHVEDNTISSISESMSLEPTAIVSKKNKANIIEVTDIINSSSITKGFILSPADFQSILYRGYFILKAGENNDKKELKSKAIENFFTDLVNEIWYQFEIQGSVTLDDISHKIPLSLNYKFKELDSAFINQFIRFIYWRLEHQEMFDDDLVSREEVLEMIEDRDLYLGDCN